MELTLDLDLYEPARRSDYDGPTLLDALEKHAREIPHTVAVTFTDDDGAVESFSFAELRARALSIAAELRFHADPGDRALLLYPAGIEFIAAFLGALHAGVIAVPAAVPRRSRGAERIGRIIDNCSPRLILTASAIRSSLEKCLVDSSCSSMLTTDEIDTGRATVFDLPGADRIAFLQYTSGSTGSPRGVMVSHANLGSNLANSAEAFAFSRDSVMASWLPLFHDMGLIGNVLAPLFTGFPTHLMSPAAFIRRPMAWLEMITRQRATCAGAPNFGWDYCARVVTEEEKRRIDLSSLTIAYNGSEPIRGATLDRFTSAFASCGFDPAMHFPCYGLAEATLFVTGGPVGAGARRLWFDIEGLENGMAIPGGQRSGSRELVSCGPGWLDTGIVIVDPLRSRRSEPGMTGEIWLRGSSVAQGYWEDVRATAATFDAWLDDGAGPFLRTGDMGVIVDGELFVTGRLKDMIIIRGRNLYPQDIEATVEEVVEWAEPNGSAAVGLDGGTTESLAIVIEATRGIVRSIEQHRSADPGTASNPPAIESIFASINAAIADRFDVSAATIALVRPGAFPRTTSGKVQRRACRDLVTRMDDSLIALWRAGADDETISENAEEAAGTTARPADDAALEGMRDIVRACFRSLIEREKIRLPAGFDDHSNITALGLDSLSLAQLALSIEAATGRMVREDLLYECETITAVADLLMTAPARKAPTETRSAERSELSLMEGYCQRNERYERWRKDGEYFFHTEISAQSGSHVVTQGEPLLMMGSYSYLGLHEDRRMIEAACDATRRFGTGAHGARVLSGTTELHVRLERKTASMLGAEDAIVTSSGYVANISTIAALVGPGDVVIGDEWNHASIADGCNSSGATFRSFAHNDMTALERELAAAGSARTLVVVDAVYSMEGDIAPIPEIVGLCRRYDALLMVDEAHSLGVLGRSGRGIQEHFDLADDAIDIKMGCFSKALASAGGYIAGRRELIDYLRHHCRGYLFSSAVPPGQIAASLAALEILESEGELRTSRLRSASAWYRAALRSLGFDTMGSATPIVPIACESEAAALAMTGECRREGLFVVPVFYPAVPMNASRLRTCVLAGQSDGEIALAVEVLGRVGRRCGVIR